jgi:hypothetical protein
VLKIVLHVRDILGMDIDIKTVTCAFKYTPTASFIVLVDLPFRNVPVIPPNVT